MSVVSIRRNYSSRLGLLFGVFILVAGSTTDAAHAGVVVRIQLSQQIMSVAVDSADFATWPVSTARRGYRTPVGRFRPHSLAAMHYSSLYDDAPMPYSIFFHGGYAIHG